MSAIEKEMLERTKLKTKKGEERQAYLGRLIASVQDLSDDNWDKLSADAQAWANAAAKASNKGKEIAEFPDAEAAVDDDGGGAAVNGGAEPKKSAGKKAAKETGDKEPAAKASKAPAAGKSVASGEPEKRDGIQVAIKKVMLARPKISAAELRELLDERGYTVSQFTVTTIRSDFRNSLKVLRDAGLISIDV